MVKVAGELFINQINGRYGPFCVGELRTEIGNFQVKNEILDSFGPRTISGEFILIKIYNFAKTNSSNLTFIQIHAQLDWEALKVYLEPESDDNKIVSELLEQPKVVSEPLEQPKAVSEPLEQPKAVSEPLEQPKAVSEPLEQPKVILESTVPTNLEDNLIENMEQAEYAVSHNWQMLMIDFSIDRKLLNEIKGYLTTIGYRYSPLGRHFYLPDEA